MEKTDYTPLIITDQKYKCMDCDYENFIPEDVEIGELFSCGRCGTEVEVKGVKRYEEKGEKKIEIEIMEAIIEGEDWGE